VNVNDAETTAVCIFQTYSVRLKFFSCF